MISLLTGLMLATYQPASAQEPMMSKGNWAFGALGGLGHFHGFFFRKNAENKMDDDQFLPFKITPVWKFSTVWNTHIDYAITDFSTIGFSVTYTAFSLHQQFIDVKDTLSLHNKGYRLSIGIRGLRYLKQTQRTTLYMVFGSGIRFGKIERNKTLSGNETPFIEDPHFLSPEKKILPYLNLGFGIRKLVYKRLGIQFEGGFMDAWFHTGLFYSLPHKLKRKQGDELGW